MTMLPRRRPRPFLDRPDLPVGAEAGRGTGKLSCLCAIPMAVSSSVATKSEHI